MNEQIKQTIKKRQRAYSQAYIAKRIGISPAYLSLIINGKRECPAALYNKIIKYLEK